MIKINTNYFDTVTSTNDLLKEAAVAGASSGTLYVASAQTKGRGRMGRNFYSPKDTGLYMSLLLRSDDIHYDMNLLTAQIAVCTASAIDRRFGVDTGIKWVNDIFWDGHKVAGILCEGTFCDTQHCVVIGIGINLNTQDWPQDIAHSAGALGTIQLSRDDRIAFAQEICDQIITFLHSPCPEWIGQYNDRSILTGKTVEVYRIADGDEHYPARVVGIDDHAHLIVVDENMVEIHLNSGEVRVKT